MARSSDKDWYSVSVDSVKLVFGLGLTLTLVAGAYYGYYRWDLHRTEQKAFEVVAKSRGLMKQLRAEQALETYADDYGRAENRLNEAEGALNREDYRQASSIGEESFLILQDILKQIRYRGQAGIAWFVTVEGDVQYRRGETGDFTRAHARDVLYPGDYVRSSPSASAEIYFNYEETRFTLRPASLFKLSRSQVAGGDGQSIGFMEYGWVALDTSQATSGVTTKFAEVTVGQNSRASVLLPENSSESRVTVSSGRAEVRSTDTGEVRELGTLQQVAQTSGRLGQAISLPGSPLLVDPPDNYSINIDTADQVKLVWNDVDGAARYALQVSNDRLFSDALIDVKNRIGTNATLGLQSTGTYAWRVAALDQAGRQGAWSPARKFRVASFGGFDVGGDTNPPELEVKLQPQGNIVIVRGTTEPGARLELNGEPIPVAANGSFSTTYLLTGSGSVPLNFRAVDGAGNETTWSRSVFIDG